MMKYILSGFKIILICIIFHGCLDSTLINVFSGKGDPDIIKINENVSPYIIFSIENMNSKVTNETQSNAKICLYDPDNKLIYEGYSDENGILTFTFSKEDELYEGFYCVTAEIKDEKYGNISFFGKLVFYYEGLNALQKKIPVYSVE